MELKIQRDSNFTIHIQLKEQIKGLILNGVLNSGSQLPTVRQLGEFLRINKNTVSKVYKEMEEEGYAFTLKGKGTFVSENNKPEKTKAFMQVVENMLKLGLENGIKMEEIWGIVYSKSQHFKMLEAKERNREIIFLECNQNSIDDFRKLFNSEIKNVSIKSIIIEELKNDFEKYKKDITNTGLIVIPYIHYEEVKKYLKKIDKEIITIGTNQSLKILTYSKKLKNKIVGVIGISTDDENAMSKQFNSINVKEFNYYGGLEDKGEGGLKNFFRSIDSIIICSTIFEKIKDKIKPKKPYFVFEGKYDKDDLKTLKEIFQ